MRVLTFLLSLLFSLSQAQQVADTLFRPEIIQPHYKLGTGPLILLDEAHNNYHTTTGRFRPFTDFLRRDGYVVKGNPSELSIDVLKPARILVIANALNAVNRELWTLPTPSAFTDSEITALNEWVLNGGSLFLIADHMPFPGSAEKLAASFGFTFYNGFAMRRDLKAGQQLPPDIFTSGGGLGESPITRGRNDAERVTSVRTFTGQGFRMPSAAIALVTLDGRFEMLLPKTAWVFTDSTTTKIPAAGLVQGAMLSIGNGKVIVFGEAAMFSAQMQGSSIEMGMNAKDAKQNPQFLLNIIHWLDDGLK